MDVSGKAVQSEEDVEEEIEEILGTPAQPTTPKPKPTAVSSSETEQAPKKSKKTLGGLQGFKDKLSKK